MLYNGFIIIQEKSPLLHPLESSGTSDIKHVVSSYKSLPLHAALKVDTKSLSGQV